MPWILWTAGGTLLVALSAVLGAMAERYESRRRRERRRDLPVGLNGVLANQAAQLEQLRQSVDAIAVEVERQGEGQRFVTRLLAERSRDADGPRRSPQPGSVSASPRPTA